MLKSRKKIIILLIVITLIMFYANKNSLIGIFKTLNSFVNQIAAEKTTMETEYYIDAEEYYKNTAEVIAVYDVATSESILSEEEITENMESRGFTNSPIYSDYSINGECTNNKELVNSEEKHPSYQTTYISSCGELWSILITNGTIIANPVSFNLESNLGAQLVISESEIITCYDAPTNKFFDVIPDETSLIVKVVKKIDAETLDNLTIEVLKGE